LTTIFLFKINSLQHYCFSAIEKNPLKSRV
jgi:hypothetical protein